MPVPIILGLATATGVTAAVGAGVATAIGLGTVGTIAATAIGAGVISGAITAVQGGDAGDVLKSAVLGGATSFIGGTIGEAVFGAAGSGVSQAALDAANATADPIAAMNAIQGWTTSDVGYLASIGASQAILDAATANNAALTDGSAAPTNIPQAAVEEANLTTDPIAALNASQGWTANDIGYLYDIGATKSLISTAIQNNLAKGIQPTTTDLGLENWMGIDETTRTELLNRGVDPTKVVRSPDGTFSYATADGSTSYQVSNNVIIKPGGNSVVGANGTIETIYPDGSSVTTYPDGTAVRSAYPNAPKVTYNPDGTIDYSYPDGTEVVTAPVRTGSPATLLPGQTVNPDGTITQMLDDGSTITFSSDGNIVGSTPSPYDFGPPLPTTGPGPTTVQNPDGSTTQTFDDGSTLITQPDGSVTATDAITGGVTDAVKSGPIDGVGPTLPSAETNPTITTNPDGSTTQIFDDGSTLTTAPDGSISTTDATNLDFSGAITPPGVIQNPDGSTTQTFDDGSTLTTAPDGSVTATDATNNDFTGAINPPLPGTQNPDGSTTQTFDDGSTLTTNPDGTITTTPGTNLPGVGLGAGIGGWTDELLSSLGLGGLSSDQILKLMAAGALAPAALQALGIVDTPATATGPNYGDRIVSSLPKLTDKALVKPGLQPGLMPVEPYYQTTRQEQPQYYWGVRPYVQGEADLQKMRTQGIPGAPEVPFGYNATAPSGFDVNEFIRQTINPQQSQAIAGAGGNYQVYSGAQPTTPVASDGAIALPVAPETVPGVAPAGSQFANFYASPEYQQYMTDIDGGIGTADMYNSPYFGMMPSGSKGRAQDVAYENYLTRTSGQPFVGPVQPTTVIGG